MDEYKITRPKKDWRDLVATILLPSKAKDPTNPILAVPIGVGRVIAWVTLLVGAIVFVLLQFVLLFLQSALLFLQFALSLVVWVALIPLVILVVWVALIPVVVSLFIPYLISGVMKLGGSSKFYEQMEYLYGRIFVFAVCFGRWAYGEEWDMEHTYNSML